MAQSSWSTPPAQLPEARYDHVSFVHNGRLYILGGIVDGAPSGDIKSAPLDNKGGLGAWRAEQSMLANRSLSGALVSPRGILYVVGGRGTVNDVAAVNYAEMSGDGRIGMWKTALPLPQGTAGHKLHLAGDCLYVIGGAVEGVATGVCWMAKINGDGSLQPWQRTSALPVARAYHALAKSGDYVYVIGGVNADNEEQAVIYSAYVLPSGGLTAWKSVGSTAIERAALACHAVEDVAYLAGGVDGGAPTVAGVTTVTFTNASDQVVGVNTLFSTELSVGDLVRPVDSDVWYEVESIEDDENLTLVSNFSAATAADVEMEWQTPGASGAVPGTSLTFTQNDADVVGVDTDFVQDLSVGDLIQADGSGKWYTVLTITDETNLILSSVFEEATATGNANSATPGAVEILAGISVTFTNGSDQVTGVGIDFGVDLDVGQLIRPYPGEEWYQIASIESATELTLTAEYLGATVVADLEYQDATNLATVDAIKLDPGGQVGRIVSSAALTSARRGASMAGANGILYLSGGTDGEIPVATIEVASATEANGLLSGIGF